MANVFLPIGKLFNIEKGSLQSTKCTAGKYTFITASRDWKTHLNYTHECEALVFAAAASGSLGRTHYVDEKFIASDLCFILTPKDHVAFPINIEFYHFVFKSLRSKLVTATKSGTSKESINQKNFKKYEIPYFNIEQQNLWIDRLKNTLAKKEAIEEEVTFQKTTANKFRRSILLDAVSGRLTKTWRKDHIVKQSASSLLEKISACNQMSSKKRKIDGEKNLQDLPSPEKRFPLPSQWTWCSFSDIANIASNLVNPYDFYDLPHVAPSNIEKGTGKLLEYQSAREDKIISGKHLFKPGQLLYSKVRPQLNKIVSVDFQGLCSADMYPLEPFIENDYLHILMLSDFFLNEVDKFDNRVKMPKINQKQLNRIPIPLPPTLEQIEIVRKVKALLNVCTEIDSQISTASHLTETIVTSVINEAFR